jgi:hypothetical protein
MSGPTVRRSHPIPGDLQGDAIVAPEGEKLMWVTAEVSVLHEGYRAGQKNGLFTCIDLWFDMHARAKGRSIGEAAAVPLYTFTPRLT